MYDAMLAETIRFFGDGGDEIEGYLAQPLGPGPFGAVVVIHHMPGYDREMKEHTRRLAAAGFLALLPNLHYREAPGASPDDAAAASRAAGGVPDDRLVGDVAGALARLRAITSSNGKVGTIGYCSGGRQSFLAACRLSLDAAVDCYGAFVAEPPPEGAPVTMQPLLPLAGQLSCPLLGLFGAEDPHPSPEATALLDAELTRLGKPHEFHTYEGAGHAFFSVDRPAYRVEAALDGWRRVLAFFGEHLAS
jgi:carboxymethylenebutenolidase